MDLADRSHVATLLEPAGWAASLALDYAHDGMRTYPTRRAHHGPLRIQRGFTPEGPDVWHQIVVHPPGGVAGGDRLTIELTAQANARVLLTSPGAAKVYRSAGPHSHQRVSIEVGEGASVEWLPMEIIVFDRARAVIENTYRVAGGGTLIASELVCLGRPAAGETFDEGELRMNTNVFVDETLHFTERTLLTGGHRALVSPAGLRGHALFGSLLVCGRGVSDSLVDAVRALTVAGDFAVTRLDGLLVARWRGDRADHGLAALRAAWAVVRPAMIGRPACVPRIWAT